jgi:Rrf2 family protein
MYIPHGGELPLQLTQAAEYAVRTMLHLASLPSGSTTSVSKIAAEWEIPETFLRKIVSSLSRSSLITTQRGVGGGIQMGCNPEKVTLLEVIESVEGPITLNQCLMGERVCPRDGWCPVHVVWIEAQEKLRAHLAAHTLSSLATEAQVNRRA